MIYDDDTLKEINANADLLSYAQQVFELEKRGNDYFAHCPLHVDNTPSLCFSPDVNSYYCFSCGKSGGIIGFLMDFEGLPFAKAVEKAAALANLDLSSMCQSKTVAFLKKWKQLLLAQKQRQPYQHEILSNATMAKFDKAPVPEWEAEGILPEVLDLFGVRIDNIGNRIVYPVFDNDGNLINVKGRTRYTNYKKLKLAKYINYFKVGTIDYLQGLNVTMPFVKEKREIIVFESIKSVMKAYGWGYKNCASAEKHTLTPEQIELLIQLRVDVVLAYDSDISYKKGDVRHNIDTLKRLTNVYVIEDRDKLLGGESSKNAPVDCGKETWENLYASKRKVV